jgi:hypothetical protein
MTEQRNTVKSLTWPLNRLRRTAIFTFWFNDPPREAGGIISLPAAVRHQLTEFIARTIGLLCIRLHSPMRAFRRSRV